MLSRLLRAIRPEHHVTLYGKPGCHLCEDARDLLDRLGTRYRIQLDEVDITSDPSLFRRYDIRIPVLLIDGTIELDAPIGEESVISALRRQRPGHPPSRSTRRAE